MNLILTRRESLRKRESRQGGGQEMLERMSGRQGIPGFGLDFDRAVGGLPEGAREVFVLYDVEGYSHQEIATRMGISTGTSKSQLHRARMMLRKFLD